MDQRANNCARQPEERREIDDAGVILFGIYLLAIFYLPCPLIINY